ncbi:hypothetical protein HPB50_004549 [Hyalomma asiaticum]|uniref:Uncharacterized protein n=1 Tax=Hyalomma asiaticum TaxID=266040 RepID=A0ACB7T636_HYAAI|nr:hypothetical protein HPB50_004549 [Hyalomma asiaticum]
MDHRTRGCGQRRGDAGITASLSTTSLSQDTQQIISSWHRFVQRRDLAQHRAAAAHGSRRLLERTRMLATSKRDAALRYLSTFPYPAERSSHDGLLSSQCSTEDSDMSEVPLGQSLCYALLVVLTGVVALSTAVVLVRLVPAATNSSRISFAHSLNAPSELAPAVTRPSPKVKSQAKASALHQPSASLHKAPSVVSKGRARQGTSRTDSANTASESGHARQEHQTTAEAGRTIKHSLPTTGDEVSEEKNHLCDLAFFTYCPKVPHEFYFNHITNSCARATTSYGVEVCNRGANRFSSRASCRTNCVDASHPSGRCHDTPLFSQCGSADLKRRLWFFEGEACRPWDFPAGKCPMADGDLFRSHGACVRKCATNETFVPLCRTPPSGICAIQRLKYPYFAIRPPGERKMRCIRTSGLSMRKHLCLTGTNRFPSVAACKRACARDASSERRG